MTSPTHCPHCHSETDPRDDIGCSRCGFVFELEDTLELELDPDASAQALEVLDASEVPELHTPAETISADSRSDNLEPAAQAEPVATEAIGEAELSDWRTPPPISDESNEEPSRADTSLTWAAIGASAAARPKRAETSALRKVMPPVLGGLCAVPIATAIMWYGMGRDLGNLGPFVAKYVPAIVPPHLRGALRQSDRHEHGRLPQMNREESSMANDGRLDRASSIDEEIIVSDVAPPISPGIDSKPPSLTPDKTSVEERSAASLVPQFVRSLKARQQELYEVPKEKKIALIAEFYQEAAQLSRQVATLKGRSGEAWRDEIAKLGRELIADASCKKVLVFGPEGKLPNVPAAKQGEFLATVLELQTSDVLAKDVSTKLSTAAHLPQVSEFLLGVDACRGSSVQGPKTFFVLGTLVPSSSDPSKLLLEIHSISPE